MTGKGNLPDITAKLRRQAEKRAREKAAHSSDELMDLSAEESRQMLHELRIHQIELEMQNEELRRAQAELDASRERYFDLYDLAPVGYCTITEKGLILEANLTAAELLNVSRNEMVNRPVSRFILKEDQDIYYLHRKRLFETAVPQVCELRMIRAGGSYVWVRLDATAAQDENGATVFRVTLSDISERRKAEEKIRYLIFHDDLTGLYNTRYLYRALGELITNAEATGEPFSLVFMDMDNFKEVVDTYGHLKGSKTLQEVAATIRGCLPEKAFGVAYGGDEFILVLKGFDREAARRKAEEIRLRLRKTRYLAGYGHNVSLAASFGAATYPDDAHDVKGLLALADHAMFEVKRTGRNAVK